jgi:hypothetical protein
MIQEVQKMQLLLKKDRQGHVLQGADRELLARAAQGDDLTLYIESVGYDEYIIFDNCVLSPDRVSALSLPHLDHGDLSDPAVLDRDPLAIVQYIYDSQANNVLTKDLIDRGQTLTTVYAPNPVYKSYTWYTTRRYTEAPGAGVENLKAWGDQFKMRLDLSATFQIVIQPDIVYFPHQDRDYLVKSAPVLLPSDLAADPQAYVAGGRPLTANENYSVAYLNVSAAGQLTIVSKQRFTANTPLDDHVREGRLSRDAEGRTSVTRIPCTPLFLVPEDIYNS